MKEETMRGDPSIAEQIRAGFVEATRALAVAGAERNRKQKATAAENEELQVALAKSNGVSVALENTLSAARAHALGLEEKLARVRDECRVEASGRLASKQVEHEQAVKELEKRLEKVRSVVRTRAEHDGRQIDGLQAEVRGLRQKNVQTEAAHEKDVARLTEAYNGAVGKHAFESVQREKSLQVQVRDAHEKAERARVLDVSVVKASYEALLLRMRADADALRTQHASAMEASSRAHEAKVAEVINTVRRDVQRVNGEMDTLRVEHERELSKARAYAQEVCIERDVMERALSEVLARAQAAEDAAAAEATAQAQAMVTNAEQHAAAMEAAALAHTQAINAERTQHAAAMEAAALAQASNFERTQQAAAAAQNAEEPEGRPKRKRRVMYNCK